MVIIMSFWGSQLCLACIRDVDSVLFEVHKDGSNLPLNDRVINSVFNTTIWVLRGVISKIRAKWGMVIIGDTADPNSALCSHIIH